MTKCASSGSLEIQEDGWGDRWSQYTFLILLSDDYQGGRTLFYPTNDSEPVAIKTPMGGVLCFPHGGHPMHLKHAGETVLGGTKYMIRTELLYRRTTESDKYQSLWIQS